MLEKYSYIKIPYDIYNIAKKVEKLFIENDQQNRYDHICSVVKQIDIIASQYNLDNKICFVAALLHDISTLITPIDMLDFAKQNQWALCEAEISHPFLLHQRISRLVAQEDFGITDNLILDAIAFHTSLCENATQYQMALFIADKLAWSHGGYPPYYKQMSEALKYSLEASCYEYIKYMETDGKMFSVHTDWEKAVKWIKGVL